MNLQELRGKIEENGLEEAKGYEDLFYTTLYDVVKETRKIKPGLILNSIAYDGGKKQEGRDVIQRLYVVYSFIGAQGVFDVALGFFEVKETEIDDFLEYAQSKEILSVVEMNLASPELVEFTLTTDQTIKFSTLGIKAKNHKSPILNSIPGFNECLWRIVEQNYNYLLKEEQQKVVQEIKQRKYINKEIKKDMKRIKGGILINQNTFKSKTIMVDGYIFERAQKKDLTNSKETLQKRRETHQAGKQIIVDLKDRKKALTPKHAKKELRFIFGEKK